MIEKAVLHALRKPAVSTTTRCPAPSVEPDRYLTARPGPGTIGEVLPIGSGRRSAVRNRILDQILHDLLELDALAVASARYFGGDQGLIVGRSAEHTSELQSLMRN